MSPDPLLSRRRFLAMSASVGLAGFLAACSGSEGGASSSVETIDANGALQIVKRFPDGGLVPGKVRLPISLGDTSGVLTSSGSVTLPKTLSARVVNSENGAVIAESAVATRHDENLDVPYWPFVLDVAEVGVYTMTIAEVPDADMSFQVVDRNQVLTPLIGDALPPFDTPTVDDSRGVDPICTRSDGTCPFHTMTLTDALKSNTPVLYLIGTPAFCQTGTCSPALEALISVGESLGDSITIVHADVYRDKSATEAAPAVQAFKLTYEPVLYITDSNGTLVDRLDAVFDVVEMRDAIAAAGIS